MSGDEIDQNDGATREMRSGLFVTAVVIILSLCFAFFFRMDEAAHGFGKVVSAAGNTPVQHVVGGKIAEVLIHEGQRVAAGQLLVRLDPVQAGASEQALGETTARLLIIQARLEAEQRFDSMFELPATLKASDAPPQAFVEAVMRDQRDALANRLSAVTAEFGVSSERARRISAQLSGIRQQIGFVDDQIRLAQEELDGLKTLLANGYVPASRVRELERSQSALRGGRVQLLSQIDDLNGQIQETRLNEVAIRTKFVDRATEDARQVAFQIAQSRPQHGAAAALAGDKNLRAPVSGWVLALAAIGPGQVLAPGDRVLYIVPDIGGTLVEAAFPPRVMNDLYVGQSVEIRLGTSGSNRIRLLKGKLVSVSHDAMIDQAGTATVPVRAAIDSDELVNVGWRRGNASGLTPGTPVEVLAIVRRRSAVEYFLEPLTNGAWRAFHEN